LDIATTQAASSRGVLQHGLFALATQGLKLGIGSKGVDSLALRFRAFESRKNLLLLKGRSASLSIRTQALKVLCSCLNVGSHQLLKSVKLPASFVNASLSALRLNICGSLGGTTLYDRAANFCSESGNSC
jgi:hypothetical protein